MLNSPGKSINGKLQCSQSQNSTSNSDERQKWIFVSPIWPGVWLNVLERYIYSRSIWFGQTYYIYLYISVSVKVTRVDKNKKKWEETDIEIKVLVWFQEVKWIDCVRSERGVDWNLIEWDSWQLEQKESKMGGGDFHFWQDFGTNWTLGNIWGGRLLTFTWNGFGTSWTLCKMEGRRLSISAVFQAYWTLCCIGEGGILHFWKDFGDQLNFWHDGSWGRRLLFGEPIEHFTWGDFHFCKGFGDQLNIVQGWRLSLWMHFWL